VTGLRPELAQFVRKSVGSLIGIEGSAEVVGKMITQADCAEGRPSLCQAGWREPDCVYLWDAGAGKSSLAFPLAAERGYLLVTKDLVKKTL